MKKITILFLALLLIASTATMAQVAINADDSQPDASAILDLKSTNKGFLLPRMTQTQRYAIANPPDGSIIYNTTTNCINVYVAPNWFEVCGEALPLPAALGNSFTSFSNGAPSNEYFSANSTCANKLISAGHSEATCSGTVTTPNATYNMVLINGQCWMKENLKEPSTAPCGDAINTGCNTWLASNPADIGSWGYYNTVTTNGTAGWGTTEPAAGEGLLYQWSAAMNGSNTERAQGVCPPGWHIPSDCEWMYLEHGQGMSIAEQTKNNIWRSTTGEGSKLSTLILSGNNSSGFTALLVGYRFADGTSGSRGAGDFWSSSEATTATNAQSRNLISYNAGVGRNGLFKARGLSVRCLKD